MSIVSNLTCNNSFDCNFDGVERLCYKSSDFENETNFCGCSSYYGWTGEKCNDIGPTVIYNQVMVILLLIINTILLLYTIKVLFLFCKIQFFTKNENNRKNINPVFYVLILSTITVVLYLVSTFLRIGAYFDPTAYVTVELKSYIVDDYIELVDVNGILANTFVAFSVGFQCLSTIIIILSWFDILVNITKIFPSEDFWSETKLKTVVSGIITIFLLILIVFSVLKLSVEITIAYVLLSLALTIALLIGYICFERKISKFRNIKASKSQKKTGISLIKLSFKVNLICFIVVLIVGFLYSFLVLDYEKTIKIGGFNYILVFLHVGAFGTFFILFFTVWYCNQVINKLFAKEINRTKNNSKARLELEVEKF